MAKEIYCLSGLGVDERVFQKLNFSGYSITFIKWITPVENESMEHYASRLLEQIESKNPVLIGLSFGGMMAIEIAKQIETEMVVLISSSKNKWEVPLYYRMTGKLRLHKLLPLRLIQLTRPFANWIFGAKSCFDKTLLKQILLEMDLVFLKWAIDKIVNWKNETTIKSLLHIHGTNDHILPFRFVNCDLKIKGGGHLMVLNRAEEMNMLLAEILEP